MEIFKEIGKDDIAKVYIGKTRRGNLVEFVESIPTGKVEDKWVLIVSTLNGCPIGCKMCDAGLFYKGLLTYDEIMEQIEYPITKRFPEGKPRTKRFKVQFARMGEPSFNMAVLDVIKHLGDRYPNFYPSISTVAPKGTDEFFKKLMDIKKSMFPFTFQLQFSIHTTDFEHRKNLIPVKTWSFEEMAEYGIKFYDPGGKKITLNFALAKENKVDARAVREHFPKEYFLIKITPLNPTVNARKNSLNNDIDLKTGLPRKHIKFIKDLMNLGYDVIVALNRSETEENRIGSNCGQHVLNYLRSNMKLSDAYLYVE